MGISIQNNFVSLIDSNDGVSFDLKSKIPNKEILTPVYYFFEFLPFIDKNNKDDRYDYGIPLMYALKNSNYYQIDTFNKNKIFKIINEATLHYQDFFNQYDFIISMPSSDPLLVDFINQLQSVLKLHLYSEIFTKKLNKDFNINEMPEELRQHIKNNPCDVFKMKKINPTERSLFNPLLINKEKLTFNKGAKILIIDDLATTGVTLKCAKELLSINGFEFVDSFSFFTIKNPFQNKNRTKYI